jgi:hypothetical protein
MSFSSLAPRDYYIIWLSCLYPFHHLLPGPIELFGFPVYILFITCSQGLLNYLSFLFMSFSSLTPRDYYIIWLSCLCPFAHLLPGTIILFGFPVYILLLTCSHGLLNYLAFLFMSFSSLAPRDYQIIWLSCLCPFDHLLPATIKLFDFPVYVLLITCSQGLLNYLAFLFMSFSSLSPRDH